MCFYRYTVITALSAPEWWSYSTIAEQSWLLQPPSAYLSCSLIIQFSHSEFLIKNSIQKMKPCSNPVHRQYIAFSPNCITKSFFCHFCLCTIDVCNLMRLPYDKCCVSLSAWLPSPQASQRSKATSAQTQWMSITLKNCGCTHPQTSLARLPALSPRLSS